MKTRILDQFQQNAIDVFVFDRLSETTLDDARIAVVELDGTFQFVDGKDKMKDQFSEVSITPTVRLPIPVVREIVNFYLKNYPTANDADALLDARKTRDRLFELVESQAFTISDIARLAPYSPKEIASGDADA